jgi:hypothetical protein
MLAMLAKRVYARCVREERTVDSPFARARTSEYTLEKRVYGHHAREERGEERREKREERGEKREERIAYARYAREESIVHCDRGRMLATFAKKCSLRSRMNARFARERMLTTFANDCSLRSRKNARYAREESIAHCVRGRRAP